MWFPDKSMVAVIQGGINGIEGVNGKPKNVVVKKIFISAFKRNFGPICGV